MLRPSNDWEIILADEFSKSYFSKLEEKVDYEYLCRTVFPPHENIFRALDTVGYDNIKVVIIGQDPYHGDGEANGIAFAVNNGVRLPPSLKNIFKEIETDLSVKMPDCGTLLGWAKQGVLLLNTSLTVLKDSPNSHSCLGWQCFTDAVIKKCSEREKPIAFILWGAKAIAKKEYIAPHHLVLSSPHPSPFSARLGFFGCRHFSKVNSFLEKNGVQPIDWTDVEGAEEKSYYRSKGAINQI